ncbi:hypothetical protein [Ornithobacterium rhinotracheale]|uniref:hypothetical protein n=1 Tax=Ornithobacterium rhinotracheale TaxID=28251 RepID=UPI00403587C4
MKTLLNTLFLFSIITIKAQVGFQTLTPEKSAMLDIKANGNKKTVTIPRIPLNSREDKTSINGNSPAHGLMIYNTNEQLKDGKGIYWWDNNKQKWMPIINQKNIERYKNLAQYYVKNTEKSLDITELDFMGENPYEKGEKLDKRWIHIKDLDMDFKINKQKNVSSISFTGSIGWSRYVINAYQDISLGFGVFVDGELVSGKADVILLRNYCGFYTYYITAIVKDLKPGDHKLQFAIQKRSRSVDSERNGLVIGGGELDFTYQGDYTPRKCKLINPFEAQQSATLYIIQEP